MSIEAMKHVIEDLVSAMKYHIDQTRPIHRTIIAIEDAEEILNAIAEAESYAAAYPDNFIKDWVGLTLEDKQEYINQDFGGNRLDAMDWAEKRLKEKNQ